MSDLTDADINAALERGRIARLYEPRAVAAHYDRDQKRVVLDLTNGCTFAFPPHLAQGLESAPADQLAQLLDVVRAEGGVGTVARRLQRVVDVLLAVRRQRADAELAGDPVADLVSDAHAALDVPAERRDEHLLGIRAGRLVPLGAGDRRNGRRGEQRGDSSGRERGAMRSLHSRNLQNVDRSYPDLWREVRRIADAARNNMGEEGLEPPTSCV